MIRRPPRSTLFPYTSSSDLIGAHGIAGVQPLQFLGGQRRARKAERLLDALLGLAGHAGQGFLAMGKAQDGQSALSPQELQWLDRSEEHTSELQSQSNLVCRL